MKENSFNFVKKYIWISRGDIVSSIDMHATDSVNGYEFSDVEKELLTNF